MSKKQCGFIGFFLVFVSFLFAQNMLVDRYLAAATNCLENKEYEKSFSYINFVLGQYDAASLPQNIEIIAEEIYYNYLVELRETKKTNDVYLVQDKLLHYPSISSNRIDTLLKTLLAAENANTTTVDLEELKKLEEQAVADKVKIAQIEAEKAALERYLKDLQQKNASAQEDSVLKQLELLDSQKNALEQAILSSQQSQQETTGIVTKIVIISIVIIFLVFATVIIISITSNRNAKRQQQQFEQTLQVVAQMNLLPKERHSLNSISNTYELEDLRYAGTSSVHLSLPETEFSDEEYTEIKQITAQCEKIGQEIDVLTGRKNNSRNVADLVYKITNKMEISQIEKMLYYAAGFIYDVGFLKIDPQLFLTESLTEEEKYTIRSHVQVGIEYIDFIPEKYRQIFVAAILMHHENMDGSGYTEGILGDSIPLVARIIHVAESFNALVSRRNYHGIFDKESAIVELRKASHIYDQEIVGILDSIV
ncbi:MAG: hypothetical protein E7062_00590 [Spirochaetaceae bacterium]|nr:hypothetical protein [Spirochaetaceae bacterium]